MTNNTKNFRVGKFELDDNQMELLKNDTNSLVIAGAGTGKTLTILGKVNFLIQNNYCKDDEILIISFTNASVTDIKNRLNYNSHVYTFHKLSMEILSTTSYKYTLCPANYLKYIINEYVHTANKNKQKTILKFCKSNVNFTHFLKTKQYYSFCNLIETFINLFKTNNIAYMEILNKKYSKLEKQILTIIFEVYNIYITEKKSSNQLDFDDLIIYATKEVKKSNLKYKYIIIDEFQDTSMIRLNLIKEIQNYTNSKIIVVGDDWQSIYHFSGCDLNIFLNFCNVFSNVKKIYLNTTYRNSQELIQIAANFVQKNPLQLNKNLCSSKHSNAPLIFVPYKNQKNILKILLDKLTEETQNIMILSRNNNDIYNYLNKDLVYKDNIIFYKNIEIPVYTVHKSKGLEMDYVILLNCNNDFLGFPNKIENSQIINQILPNTEIKYAEERRLFYVAITRAKIKTYLVYDKNNPSIFIKEIKKIAKKILPKITYFK